MVDLLRQNKIPKVKLFDTDPVILRALMGSGIEVMVGIPNELLGSVASSVSASDAFVAQNISRFMVKGGANIKYFDVFSPFVVLHFVIISHCFKIMPGQKRDSLYVGKWY